jgi:hypothetical protein
MEYTNLPETAPALAGHLGGDRRVFAFEADFADDLRCIPMVVRFKLDRCGIKLSLKQWAKLGRPGRRACIDHACDSAAEVASFRVFLEAAVAAQGSETVYLSAEPSPPWSDVSATPILVREQAASAGVAAPSDQQWRGLDLLQRFVLVKLARSHHENENFVPALREFGLMAPEGSASG